MGSRFSKYCVYCEAGVTCKNSVVYVYSLGKLDGLYVCNECLFDIHRRKKYKNI
jgi:hypothetical protein